MPTNDERREIAARLRYVAEHGAPEWETSADCIAICLKEPDSPLWSGTEKLFALLADLIEPEPERMCHIEKWPLGTHIDDGCADICSNCRVAIESDFYYCPNCGSKVVE